MELHAHETDYRSFIHHCVRDCVSESGGLCVCSSMYVHTCVPRVRAVHTTAAISHSGLFFHRCYFSQPTVIPKCFSAECFSKQSSLVPQALFTRASAAPRFNMPPLICWSADGCMLCSGDEGRELACAQSLCLTKVPRCTSPKDKGVKKLNATIRVKSEQAYTWDTVKSTELKRDQKLWQVRWSRL